MPAVIPPIMATIGIRNGPSDQIVSMLFSTQFVQLARLDWADSPIVSAM
jgi:hypothetical protein